MQCKIKVWYTLHTSLESLESVVYIYLSSRWGVLCTKHPENSSPGSILSASAFWAVWKVSGWCDWKTRWSIWIPFHHSPHSFLKNLQDIKMQQLHCFPNICRLMHDLCQLATERAQFSRNLAHYVNSGSFTWSERSGTHWPKSAFFPFSSGKKRRSTAHTKMCSGTVGDLAPTSSKPAGTSMGSVAMETRRRSFPAWQKPERWGGGNFF